MNDDTIAFTASAVTQPIELPPLRPSTPLDDFYITLASLPSSIEVQAYAEKHPSSNATAPALPLWALVCLWGGVALLLGFALLGLAVAYLVLVKGAFL